MNRFTIELGIDLKAKELYKPSADYGAGSPYFYMPAGITDNQQICSYCQLRPGDEIEFIAFNITSLPIPRSSSRNKSDPIVMESPQEDPFHPEQPVPFPLKLEATFEDARVGQECQTPFAEDVISTTVTTIPERRHSLIFGHRLRFSQVYFSGRRFLPIRNDGFFIAKYQFQLCLRSMPRVYRHDPEWIIEPF